MLVYQKGEELIQLKEEKHPILYRGEVIRPKGYEVTTGVLIVLSLIVSVNKEILDKQLEGLHRIINLEKTNYHESLVLYAWKVFHQGVRVWDKKVIKSELEIVLDPLFRDLKGKDDLI